MQISVVGRIDAQMFRPHVLLRSSRKLQRVLNCGIALQRCTETQPIVEHSGDQRAFFGRAASRAPRERRESQFVSRQGRRESCWLPMDSIRSTPTRKCDAIVSATCTHVVCRLNSYVEGNRNPSSDFRLRSDVGNQAGSRAAARKLSGRADSLAVEFSGDVKHRPAFRNGHVVQEYSPLRDFPENLL